MIALALALLTHLALACEDLEVPPERLQVAWISPRDQTVRSATWLEVVRVTDLRAWIRDNGADLPRMLKGLGMVKRKGGRKAELPYKITIFDVQRDWLCRPLDERAPGEDAFGVSTCAEPQQAPLRGHRPGFTGCGYSLDTDAATRGLEVFRVQWEVASAWGFCVMPLERFVGGA